MNRGAEELLEIIPLWLNRTYRARIRLYNLELPNGISSHDTMQRFFAIVPSGFVVKHIHAFDVSFYCPAIDIFT